jgi:hypothetical protein
LDLKASSIPKRSIVIGCPVTEAKLQFLQGIGFESIERGLIAI